MTVDLGARKIGPIREGNKEMTLPNFTFIETDTTEMPEGMMCDPVTGLCGPIPEENVETKEKSEADE